MIPPALIQAIQSEARRRYPQECCGVVVASGVFVPLKNIHRRPEKAFKIDPAALEAMDVTAIVHSHPDGVNGPSAWDMAQQQAMGIPWIIVKVTAEGCKTPLVLGGTPAPLLGRRFRHGVQDCYALVQDWFEAQGQRDLTPEVPRDWAWWRKGQDLYLERYQAAGWRPTNHPEVGSVGLIKTHGSPVFNHAGVLLEGGWFLHHLVGKLSMRERIERWSPQIGLWLAHPAFISRGP